MPTTHISLNCEKGNGMMAKLDIQKKRYVLHVE